MMLHDLLQVNQYDPTEISREVFIEMVLGIKDPNEVEVFHNWRDFETF